jgi:hypothetical protein
VPVVQCVEAEPVGGGPGEAGAGAAAQVVVTVIVDLAEQITRLAA